MSPARLFTPRRLVATMSTVGLLLVVAAFVALVVGPSSVDPASAMAAVSGHASSSTSIIIFDIRLPRIILAVSAGGALAGCGVLFQALLRNPLAEPYILGVSNGCAVGAILGFLLGVGSAMVPILSIAGGLVTVGVVLSASRGSYGSTSESMLLGGVMVGAIGAAILFLLLHLLGPQLRSAIQWMLGDLSSTSATVGYASGGLFLVLLVAALFFGDGLNALAMGDEEASSLGVPVARLRIWLYVAGSVLVGVTVAYCGAIGFVGLVVPHILRRLFGADHRAILPLSVLGGGLFLLVCDTLARSFIPAIDIVAGELPIGAVTALVGAPLFIWLLRRRPGL